MARSRIGASSGKLIIAPAWIGDMVMAHCLVQRIHQAEPDTPIHMVAPAATAPVARRMAEVTAVHVLEIGHGEFGLGRRWALGRQLAREGIARSYVLPNSWKSALVPLFAGIKRRSGWLGEARYGLLNDTARLPADLLPLMIERFMALQDLAAVTSLEHPYPQPRLTVDVARQSELFADHGLSGDGTAVALCPGAEFGQAKRWPAEHFSRVAHELLAGGRQVWLLGGPADTSVCAEIQASSAHADGVAAHNLAGKTQLTDAIDLLAGAAAVVCNDSGLMHVASAVDTPAIALYGSTSPGFTPPLHPGARALTLVDLEGGKNRLACQPCFERECRFKHGDCLRDLTPDYVLTELSRLGLLTV